MIAKLILTLIVVGPFALFGACGLIQFIIRGEWFHRSNHYDGRHQ